nr:olfactory receptor 2AK2-like [Loxodonta africana]
MKTENQTFGAEFILLGFFQYGCGPLLSDFDGEYHTDPPHPIGHSIHLIRLDTPLHTPMYFLLSQLSFIDMMYISTTVPKMAANFLSNDKTITSLDCKIQTFVVLTLGGTEALLLGFMSYDRYVAICHPLHYPVLMSKTICLSMVTCAWASSSINALIHTLHVFQLPFCTSRIINHFFCEVPSLMPLVCQDTSQYEYTVLFSVLIVLLLPFMAILASYA